MVDCSAMLDSLGVNMVATSEGSAMLESAEVTNEGNVMLDSASVGSGSAGVSVVATSDGLQGIITELMLLKSVQPTDQSVGDTYFVVLCCSEFIMKSKRELEQARHKNI